MYRSLLFVVLLFPVFHVQSQLDAHFNFTHYSTSTGLISNQVNAVAQDETGYIWIGTVDGLVRFDGIRYKVFRHRDNDPNSIASNPILALLIDRFKNLWILTSDGHIGIFDTKNHRYSDVRVRCKNESILKGGSKILTTDDQGNIFLILGANEILMLDKKKNEFSSANLFFHTPESWGYTALAQQPGTNKYWMAIQGGGIAIYDSATRQMSCDSSNTAHEDAVEKFKGLQVVGNFLFDSKGRVWCCVWGPGYPYVYCYDTKTKKLLIEKYEFLSSVLAYNEIYGFFEQRDGTIWAYGLRIFAHFDEDKKAFSMVSPGYINERSIDYRNVYFLYEDREHNIWVGTGNNGLFRFNPKETFFSNVMHPGRNPGTKGDGNPMGFLYDKDGSVLTAPWGVGFFRYNKDFNLVPLNITCPNKTKPFDEPLWCFCPSADSNTVWISAQPGLYVYNQEKRTAEYFNPSTLGNHTVRRVVEDLQGNLWLGMQKVGLFKWNVSPGNIPDKEGPKKVEAVKAERVNHIIRTKDGKIWVGTLENGLYVIDPRNDSVTLHFNKSAAGEQQLPENAISYLLEYNDSLVVISMSNHILLYNKIKNKSFSLRSPDIFSGFIAAMERDSTGNLWVSTTSGLYRINLFSNITVNYNRDDGITSDYFILASSYHLPDGRLLFGAAGQFVVFDPERITRENKMSIPQINITDIRVQNKSLLVDSVMQLKEITLNHTDNSLVIDFSMLSFSNPLLIQYQLEGLDKEWRSGDKTSQAIYSYLPPGDYYLHFRTIDPEGKINPDKVKLAIHITPPFWRTWWFYSMIGLFAALLIYWFDREWLKRKAVVQKMRSDIADNLHEEVNNALGNINILSEMALMKSEKEPEKSKEFIKQIHSRSHNMIIALDDMLWSISPDNDSMEKTVDRMREYIDALQNRHGIQIELLVDKNIDKLELNMKLRHEAFVLFKDGIQSLVTAGVHYCAIQIGPGKNALLYTMQFNNAGCDMQQLNNLLQRRDMETRMNAINAVFHVEVHKTNSVFTLQVPVLQ